MARYSRASLSLLLLACCALMRSSYGSRPPPLGSQKHAVLSPMVHGAAQPRRLGDTEEGATGHHGVDADDDAVTASTMGVGDVVPSEQRKGSGLPVLQQALGRMLGSKLARRILGGEAEDSAAGPSCHSNNAHITCAPPAQH
ncbi:uncharacterized protein LOC119294431 [Triticum dicoccoides]|uniref:Uncharacterized protein n=1 Tax=Triticum turgidum subsp. durum TaxID=4567 RepID=A0A9R0SUG8_TRITD|nr:uncharacterized protein LOC119294431 [Triticum dicoccoides]XP_044372318.1 uncharacterized protein LOC123094361 [Triticum aestivum]VAI01685.1 unnamed protein product [Triticum turgidum subsp. durum]